MVRNVGLLQNLTEMTKAIPNDSIRNLAENISKKSFANRFNIDDDTFMFGTIGGTQPMQDQVYLPAQLTHGNVRYSQRLRHKHNTYHSLCYHYKRNSNSYTVFYDNPLGGGICYGEIMFFLLREEGCFMVVREMVEREGELFDESMIGCLSERVDYFIQSDYLGKCFVKLNGSSSCVAVPIRLLKGRVLPVTCDHGTYASHILSSYQHD